MITSERLFTHHAGAYGIRPDFYKMICQRAHAMRPYKSQKTPFELQIKEQMEPALISTESFVKERAQCAPTNSENTLGFGDQSS